MGHEFKAGDWCLDCQGERVLIIGVSSRGNPICEWSDGDIMNVSPSQLTPLPGCTGWLPQQVQSDVPDDDDPDGIDENDDDDAYVCLRVKRAVWDAVADGSPVPPDSITEATEMVKLVQMPGAKLLLLTE